MQLIVNRLEISPLFMKNKQQLAKAILPKYIGTEIPYDLSGVFSQEFLNLNIINKEDKEEKIMSF